MSPRYMDHDVCENCKREYRVDVLNEISVLTAKATMASPAEYDLVYVCDECLHDERDPAYEKANRIFGETHGGEL